MKSPLLIVLAASLALCGCEVFRRSPTWDTVVSSRSGYSSSADPKDDYINHLHQLLSQAGVEHKIVTYQFHFHNVYREESVDTAVAVLYRDETTPRDPWWGMDEYHHVPVWLPSWEVDRQVGFFQQRPVEIISVKEYRGATPVESDRKTERPLTGQRTQEQKLRSLFANHGPKLRAERPAKPVAVTPRRKEKEQDPLAATSLAPRREESKAPKGDRSAALFRSVHGTIFDPNSPVDREKMLVLMHERQSRKQSSRSRRD